MEPAVEDVMMRWRRRFHRIMNGFFVAGALTMGPLGGMLATGDVLFTAIVTSVMLVLVLFIGWTNRKQTLPVEQVWSRGPERIKQALLGDVHESVEPLAGGDLLVPKWPWVAPVWVIDHPEGARVVTGSTVADIWRRRLGASIIAAKPHK